ncbi:DinB family protein [Flavobacterium antarcticum]|uniref:DinB family protein n=1 Tax=Flavobacterium antarcticum TaxID=271155 RepID=UPI0003B5B989|nr:DinB family protein [Flavobacterium antarcticum]
MTLNTEILLEDLISRTQTNIKEAEKYSKLSIETLNSKVDPNSWSVLECLEHLNLYGDFYLPEIKKRMEISTTIPRENFKSGFLGNYFAMAMVPKKPLKKMKTFKDKNPIGSELDQTTISRFIKQQEVLLQLLEKAKTVDLSKIKTAISISKLIKLKLGDTFRVVVYHNDRHILQANKILVLK